MIINRQQFDLTLIWCEFDCVNQRWIKEDSVQLFDTNLKATDGINMERKKKPFRVVLRKSCSENMQQIYRRTPISKCDCVICNFIEIALRHGCSLYEFAAYFQNTFS